MVLFYVLLSEILILSVLSGGDGISHWFKANQKSEFQELQILTSNFKIAADLSPAHKVIMKCWSIISCGIDLYWL